LTQHEIVVRSLSDVFCSFFPDKDIREQQQTAFDFIETGKQTKHIILGLPTGSGKSIAGMTYGLSFEEPFFVTTPQKMLQKQYIDTIDESLIGTFYGRSNYTCVFSNDLNETNCENGHVPGAECPDCPYKAARIFALSKQACIVNTALQFNNTPTPAFKERRILIIDEAHNLEKVLCDFNMLTISKNRCEKLNIDYPKIKNGELKKFLKFANEKFIPAVTDEFIDYYTKHSTLIDYIKRCFADDEKPELTDTERKISARYNKLKSGLDTLKKKLSDADESPENFVLCTTNHTLDMKYLKAHVNFIKYIESQYDHVLYMSATFGSLDGFARDMGITDYKCLDVDPFFENANGSFKFIPLARNTAKVTDEQLGKLFTGMLNIVQHHNDQKGIIHTVNYKQNSIVCDVLESHGIKVFTHESKDKIDKLEEFMEYDGPAVFVSPSSTEGLDLPDDLCRFIIFTKVPWLNLGDQWVKERMKDGDWYLRQAVITTIQACGRGIRHMDDWCNIYMLDESFDRIIPEMGKWYTNQFKKGAGR